MCASIFTSRLSNAAQASGATCCTSAKLGEDERSLHLQTCGRWPARHQTFPSNFTGWTISSVPSQPDLARRDGDLRHLLVELSCGPRSRATAAPRLAASLRDDGERLPLLVAAVFMISSDAFFPRAATLLATAAASRPAAARRQTIRRSKSATIWPRLNVADGQTVSREETDGQTASRDTANVAADARGFAAPAAATAPTERASRALPRAAPGTPARPDRPSASLQLVPLRGQRPHERVELLRRQRSEIARHGHALLLLRREAKLAERIRGRRNSTAAAAAAAIFSSGSYLRWQTPVPAVPLSRRK